MTFVDLYPEGLNTEGSPEALNRADEVVYRLVLTRLAVPGLPDLVRVGDVDVHFAQGPIRTQVTVSRQRPGLPFVFDKHMDRGVLVAANELLTVAQVRRPVPTAIGRAVDEWRTRCEAAVGLLAATLDERVARRDVASDLIFLQAGTPIAAGDVHPRVRTFMPFDVTEEDRGGLADLERQNLSLDRDAARAAHFYLSATRQGPTREGFLLLWLAVDAIVGTRKTQKQAVASRLADIGFDLDWLSLPIGRLVGLRGNIAHGRVDDPDVLRAGYYDSEAIARALIRSEAQVSSGWPAMLSATSFPLPLGRRISDAERAWEEEWHEEGLPLPDDDPAPAHLPRVDAVYGGHGSWLRVEGAEGETERRVRFWAMAAIQAVGVDIGTATFQIDQAGSLPEGSDLGTSAERVLLSPSLAEPDDDIGEARLAYLLCRAVGEMHIMRLGFESVSAGSFFIELAGAWVAYREWVVGNEMPAETLDRGSLEGASLQDLGAYVGVALAGDLERREAIRAWLGASTDANDRTRWLVRETTEQLSEIQEFADLLAFMKEFYDEMQRIGQE